jgi:hypothetical protein
MQLFNFTLQCNVSNKNATYCDICQNKSVSDIKRMTNLSNVQLNCGHAFRTPSINTMSLSKFLSEPYVR